jgi:hypothetical protein
LKGRGKYLLKRVKGFSKTIFLGQLVIYLAG